MKNLQQKVAYLQGLADGMELEDSKEGKVIAGILEALEEMAEQIEAIYEQQADMEDYLESIDSDLADVEDEIFGDEEDGDEDNMVDVECPNCHETACFDESILYDEDPIEVICPNCEAVVFSNEDEFEVEDGDEDGCSCGCGCSEQAKGEDKE